MKSYFLVGWLTVGCLSIIGCKQTPVDPNAPPPPPPVIGHVRITKTDSRVTEIYIDLNRSEWRVTDKNEAQRVLLSFQAIVSDFQSAVDEMKVVEPSAKPN